MDYQSKGTKISVRLSKEASDKLQEAKLMGYTTSQYVENLIMGSAIADIGLVRSLATHVNNIQTILEFETDPQIQNDMREELNNICRCLKLSQNSI